MLEEAAAIEASVPEMQLGGGAVSPRAPHREASQPLPHTPLWGKRWEAEGLQGPAAFRDSMDPEPRPAEASFPTSAAQGNTSPVLECGFASCSAAGGSQAARLSLSNPAPSQTWPHHAEV
jgi:hypothetical protein